MSGRWIILLALALAPAACSTPPPVAEAPAVALSSCGDGVALDRGDGRLSIGAARDAHRWSELRRHLQMWEEVEPGFLLAQIAALTSPAAIGAGDACLEDLYVAGRLIFEHEYGSADGLGTAETDPAAPFSRVQDHAGGPDSQACTSCHWRGGPGGAGSLPDVSLLLGDGERTSSADRRNPPALHGVGIAQALAAEMSQALASQRDQAVRRARAERRPVEIDLVAKEVPFGRLRAYPDGAVDTTGVVGIDADLVVKPLGWKGTHVTVGEFVDEALLLHLGITTSVGAGPAELGAGLRIALVTYLTLLEAPVVRPPESLVEGASPAPPLPAPLTAVYVDEWARGSQLFTDIGCASCHRPMMVLDSPIVRIEGPDGPLIIDLSREGEAPLAHDPMLGGYPVFPFSDFKRHDLGAANAAQHVQRRVPRRHYLTRRLWGLADSGPYFYDGESPTFDDAIARHGGEASGARDAFAALSAADQGALRLFLLSLRRPLRPVVP